MITPIIIQIIFWAGVVAIIVVSIIGIVTGESTSERAFSIVWLLLGPIWWRVVCEVLIIVFRMNETLTDIRNNTASTK